MWFFSGIDIVKPDLLLVSHAGMDVVSPSAPSALKITPPPFQQAAPRAASRISIATR